MGIRKKILITSGCVVVVAAISAFAISRPPPIWLDRMLIEHRYKHALVSTLVEKWGNPERTRVLKSGERLLTWITISVVEAPIGTPGAYISPMDAETGHATAQVDCAFTVKTDRSSNVVEEVQLDDDWNRDACKVWLDWDRSKSRNLMDPGPDFPPPPSSLGPAPSQTCQVVKRPVVALTVTRRLVPSFMGVDIPM